MTVPGVTVSWTSCASTRTSFSRRSARRGSFMSMPLAFAAAVVRRVLAASARIAVFDVMATLCFFDGPARPVSPVGFVKEPKVCQRYLLVDLEHREKRFLRNLHLPHPLHPLLPLFLFLEE